MDINVNELIICELADEYLDNTENIHQDLLFNHNKKQWRIKRCLTANANVLINIIASYEGVRTRKLCFQALQSQDGHSTLVLLQKQAAGAYSANALDMELAAKILPILFCTYTPTLEFEVVKEQHQRQRELKSYVTTQLYNALYSKHQEQQSDESLPSSLSLPSTFKSQLRQYQKRTVSWMLNRERLSNEFPASYIVLTTVDGQHRLFKHKYCLQFYAYENTLPRYVLPPGGILADEMGLGKTVELLATLLLHPRTNVNNEYWLNLLEDVEGNLPLKRRCTTSRKVHCICAHERKLCESIQCTRCRLYQHQMCVVDDTSVYICPNCWKEWKQDCFKLIESGATIIVSPNAIKMQWYQEISKHISSSLKVLLYPGLHTGVWYSPMQLAQYDIVLIDYSILTREIHHTSINSTDRKMRYEQRYMRSSSPLLMVNWWRVCLDEAQMVESGTSQAAEMVRSLPAINRWAVTGTPIQRTIDDLAPLLKFVGFSEACQPWDAWQTVTNSFLLNHKADPLLELLQHSMWRTCKSKVEHELGIPPQMELVHRLQLSNVESLYYRDEHCKCTELFLAAVAKHTKHNPASNSSCLASISPKLLRIILQPFLRIRKTCSIPVVLNKKESTTKYLNPQDLWAHLKSNTEMQCKREIRTWASSYNGIAAIHFIRKKYSQAIQSYKQVLKLVNDYNEEHISVDSLLQIHTLHNLMQASELASDTEQLDDEELSTLRLKLNTLERKYLDDKTSVLQSAQNAYELKLEELDKLTQQFDSSIIDLFATLINISDSLHNAIWNKIVDDLIRKNISAEKLQNLNSMSGVLYLMHTWHDSLQKVHNRLVKEFDFLKDILLQASGAVEQGLNLTKKAISFVKDVSDCHLIYILDENPIDKPTRTEKKIKNHCRLCKINDIINEFECLLFAKQLDKEGAMTDGDENPSLEIILIRVVFTFLRSKPEFSEWKTECKNKLEILDVMQSLVKAQIKYWIEAEYMIKAFDELDMCKMRMLLTDNPEEQSNFRILHCQLDEQTQFNLANIQEAQLNFTRFFCRLKYLKHLKEDVDDTPCPICQTQDDERYVMMSCGHFLCQQCLEKMKKQLGREGTSKCPMCRQYSPQLYYYVRKGANSSTVIGDFSTKIAYIVELVLKIKSGNDQEKVLIFSQWATILNYVAIALRHNGIEHRSKFTNRDIDEFKDSALNVTCLLLPLARGAKGLNLIEATHVFLIEPILTPGEELQAIGRVHRFGQTKPTTVHRFIVNGTIEENIMKLIKSADDKSTLSSHWDLDNMTLDSLRDLFILNAN
ncbi:E3 ubiquitin-protein ligase SHPRH [Drosophila grimshawi]|uniref:GH15153 n=1 Tax=Drosophila grimshawi TaxID=7222 RepID=B4IY65_DROGR|nr:E3 ubiquitin-protein ligase SHPRH [Drosophila grimshawi]EDV96515.1 GH15153 [Drosophila grimshawi]